MEQSDGREYEVWHPGRLARDQLGFVRKSVLYVSRDEVRIVGRKAMHLLAKVILGILIFLALAFGTWPVEAVCATMGVRFPVAGLVTLGWLFFTIWLVSRFSTRLSLSLPKKDVLAVNRSSNEFTLNINTDQGVKLISFYLLNEAEAESLYGTLVS